MIYHYLLQPLWKIQKKGAIVGAPSATGAAGCYLTGWMDYKPTNIAGNLFVSGCPSRDFHHFLLPI